MRGKELYVALARKLARVTWAVWYYNRPFDYSPRDYKDFPIPPSISS